MFLTPTPFSPIPTQALSTLATHLLQPCYKSGTMLDKITKTCYNFFPFCNLWSLVNFLRGFYQATLKGVAQSTF
ncbi:hypothetical protein HPHPP13_0325 [Helicobacter pylori Hp P-13]|uniref:Uncharacterized protein n=1 Tax=Helicobacter pylori Hp P-13b TaxID=992107 RepID=A0ABC9QT51_HELPX|nr:hypothetical protein HPHPP13_0325 [Helicobacter pylori Hp P-13]EJC33645.1 hypothetical protein HPHPP13B_0318 [Helicobacter pylori Hp P-13b]